MPACHKTLTATVLVLALAAAPLHDGGRETKTVEAAAAALGGLADIPLKGIPNSLVHDAAGVAIIPHAVRAGLIVDGRFGRGVLLLHEPDGRWSNPIFIALEGGGVGGQAGIESAELVLVFKTRKSLDRALRGKLTLGGDVAVAAGPLGRDAEIGSDRLLRTEIFSYSRSHGLFAGVSLEGASLHVDARANEAFYGCRGGRPADVLAHRGAPLASVEALRAELTALSAPAGRR